MEKMRGLYIAFTASKKLVQKIIFYFHQNIFRKSLSGGN